MIAALQSILTPIVNQAVAEAVKAKDEEIKRLKRELAESELKIDELERYSIKKNSLNITGLPETSGESTLPLVRDLGAMIGASDPRISTPATESAVKPLRGIVSLL